MNADAFGNDLHFSIFDDKGHPIEDAVITATPLDSRNFPKLKTSKPIVDQVNKEFMPHVMAIYVNSLVSFPNNDSIRHHVYSFSPAKKFELPLYSGQSAPPVLFDKPGIVVLGCNIHDWMLGYIYVSDTPYFVKSDQAGKGVILDIPKGKYIVKVWHPLMVDLEKSTSRNIDVSENTPSVDWKLQLKPPFKLPRVSESNGFGY